ncbi:hypothetical protein [Aureimonas psammosilenae]|uniref:hypothetical protein n=1 Tax=Aureimonas psammosilenae TaxID=2495496 RepID=UPI001260C621|nr:hypothetical protein [Aureimonas psammosilenae]
MLDTARRPVCHGEPRFRLAQALRSSEEERSTGIDRMILAMPGTDAVMTLDAVLEMLSGICPRPYDVVAQAVRARLFVVEFVATPRPFPYRELLVRRL